MEGYDDYISMRSMGRGILADDTQITKCSVLVNKSFNFRAELSAVHVLPNTAPILTLLL